MLTAEQVLATQKANVQTLLGLTGKAFEGVEQLIDLNVQVAKTALAEGGDTAVAALSVNDAQELLALQANLLQPSADKAAAYSRRVYEIVSATNAEVARVAEAQVADAQAKFLSFVDSASKNAPPGTENAAALARSAFAAINNAFESVQKAAKQATDAADANFKTITETAVKATKAPKAKRAA